jgi:hypothetical protein
MVLVPNGWTGRTGAELEGVLGIDVDTEPAM